MLNDNLFGFLSMAGNHAQRVVSNTVIEGGTIDTCFVTDSDQLYETAIEHKGYNDGQWVVVEMYDTRDEARTGHDKWVKVMTAEKLPTELKDCSSCQVKKLLNSLKEGKIDD